MTDNSPRVINKRFALLEAEPRRGLMATVYKAVDLRSHSVVALKIFEKNSRLTGELRTLSYEREISALVELSHESIARLVDHGRDAATGELFLVLDWIECRFEDALAEQPLKGWDDFFKRYGSKILDALSYAHKRHIAHRDFKPANILVSEQGQPILVDFGISKLLAHLNHGQTLARFGSPPFTPPNVPEFPDAYTRDVFGFGVSVLTWLTDVDILEHSDISRALNRFEAPASVKEFIAKCVAPSFSIRPKTAEVLQALLLNTPPLSPTEDSEKWECPVSIVEKNLDDVLSSLDVESELEAIRVLESDLEVGYAVAYYESSKNDPDHLYIYGGEYTYHMKVDAHQERSRLVLFNVTRVDAAVLERRKDGYWQPQDIVLKFPARHQRNYGRRAVEHLVRGLDEACAEARRAKSEERCFEVWRFLLKVQRDLEKERFQALRYRSFDRDGRTLVLRLERFAESDVLTHQWRLKSIDNKWIYGHIAALRGRELQFVCTNLFRRSIPRQGSLEFNTYASDVAIQRQLSALDSVRFNKAVRPESDDILRRPSTSRLPTRVSVKTFGFEGLDEPKKTAVEYGLGVKDVLLVQGPPGTGKTTFIAELVLQFLRREPSLRILLSSQTHIALDNALERVAAGLPSGNVVRVGSSNDSRVGAGVKGLLVDAQLPAWRRQAIEKSRAFLDARCKDAGVDPNDLKLASLLQDLLLAKERLKEATLRASEYELALSGTPETNERSRPILEAQLGGELDRKNQAEIMIAEVESKLDAAGHTFSNFRNLGEEELEDQIHDLMSAKDSNRLAELLRIQSEWIDRFGRSEEFEDALVQRAQVVAATCVGLPSIRGLERQSFDVCILDEASKATAPEALIPLSRSRRWVLVGDMKQLPPSQDELFVNSRIFKHRGIAIEEAKETLFDRFNQHLPKECIRLLSIQHRMIPEIGNLVSECFYEGKLESVEQTRPRCIEQLLPSPILWLSTSSKKSWDSEIHKSRRNQAEARVVLTFLQQLGAIAKSTGEKVKVALLSGYSGQVSQMESLVEASATDLSALEIECATVDVFQGREADVTVFSVTRSNPKKDLGFLKSWERVNVALSRAKYGLVIVGDLAFCKQKARSPLRRVATYVEKNTKSCRIEDAFAPKR